MRKAKKTRTSGAVSVDAPPDEELDQQADAAECATSPAPSEEQQSGSPEESSAPEGQSDVLDLRTALRESVDLKTIIQVKDADEIWKETAVVHSVSKAGAGFNLTRPCVVGRLVTLVLPLPAHLRVYDFHERLYPVMAVVQYCHEITMEGQRTYNVGTAFIGKAIPASYAVNPCQNYRLTGMGENGLWKITEAISDFKVRKHSRFWVEVEVSLTILQRDKRAVCKDVTTTQDISAGGASMKSSVVANIGDKVKFTCKDYNFFSMAVVRGRSVDRAGQPTIHVEFLDGKFPVHMLPKPENAALAGAIDPTYVANSEVAPMIERF